MAISTTPTPKPAPKAEPTLSLYEQSVAQQPPPCTPTQSEIDEMVEGLYDPGTLNDQQRAELAERRRRRA